MKTRQTFAVNFLTRKNKKASTEGLVYARISVNGQRSEFSIKKKIPFEIWDQSRGQAKGHSIAAKKLNQYLDQMRSELFDAYDALRKERAYLTAAGIKSKFFNEESSDPTVLSAVTYHYKIALTTIRPGTLKNYRTTEKYVKLFLQEDLKVKDLYLRQLKYSFITRFENFLRLHTPTDHQKKMQNNTVMKHLQRLRKIISMAVRMEWLDRDPFVHYKANYEKKERIYLRQTELDAIENKIISIDRLEYVRDLFVFSCYTGLAYIDVMQLTTEQIVMGIDGGKWIFTSRQKTGNTVKIPLLEKAEALVNKYKENPRSIHNGTVFPGISNQKLNAYLKEIADICGVRKNITFHIARHTFATTVTLTNGVPLATVSKLLGHAKITSTQIYAKVIESKLSEDMNSLRGILNHKKNVNNDQKKSKVSKVS